MPRTDILSLTDDDLASLATRGKVKEARKELDDGRVHGTVADQDGTLKVTWSDGPVSELAASTPLPSGRCSCNGIGVCKHLVRLALAYQRQASTSTVVEPSEPWDPGLITDQTLTDQLRPATFTRARSLDAAGTLVELTRGLRPVARFHVPGSVVRFLVPGDPNYARCDCARPAPCEHVALAVWAFRRLPAAARAGVITAGAPAAPIDSGVLEQATSTLREFVEQGTSGTGKGWSARLSRAREQCLTADLLWPAEVFADLIELQDSYHRHDARFDPALVAASIGELVLRLDAIASSSDAVPQCLVRGSNADRPLEIEKGLFWGLGCGVNTRRKGVGIAAYLYDCKTASVCVLGKQITEEEQTNKSSYARLGQRVAVKGMSFATLGAGVLQMDSGRRSARHELMPGRSGVGIMAQERLAWEEIASPVLVEDYTELDERLAALPPSALRPRRLSEDIHVLRVASIEQVHFDLVTHTTQAVLVDRSGKRILLEHPFTTRGKAGCESLLQRLSAQQHPLLFVSGKVRRSGGVLRISPFGLVFVKGDKRELLQPWVDGRTDEPEATSSTTEIPTRSPDPLADYLEELQEQLGELAVLGLCRTDTATARVWQDLARRGEAIGFGALAARVSALAEFIERRSHTLRWDPAPAANAALGLTGLIRLAGDVG